MHSEEEEKKKKENPPNQPTSHHSNKYKNISWQIHPFHCRTISSRKARPTAHPQRRPALLLKEISPHPFSSLQPSPLCLQAASQKEVREAAAGRRPLSAAALAHIKPLLEKHRAKLCRLKA